MNYREFNERVYNYKHGIKTVADDQSNSIEHGIVGEGGDHIAHYELGQEADNHKYKEKIYLGEGKYRYIYDDGTSSTGYKPLDYNDPARQKQRAQPLVDNFNARVETRENAQGISQKLANDSQSSFGKYNENKAKEASQYDPNKVTNVEETRNTAEGIGKFLSSNIGRTGEDIAWQQIQGTLNGENTAKLNSQINPAVNEMVTSHVNTANTAAGIGNVLKENVQSPSNKDFTNARKESYDAENKAKAPQAPASKPIPYKESEKMAAQYGGTGGETKPNTGALGTKVAPDSMKSTSAPNYASGLASNLAPTALPDAAKTGNTEQTAAGISNFLKENVQNPTNPAVPVPQGTPYSELQAQSVKTTNNQLTPKAALDNYTSQLRDAYYELNSLGVPDSSIVNLIRYAEQQALGTSIIDQLNTYDPNNNNIVFMDGAEQAFDEYSSKVIPALKAYASSIRYGEPTSYAQAYANANPRYDVPVSNDSGNASSVDPNKWYNSETDEFVSGNTSSEDNDFYKAFRSSFYNVTLNKLRNNSSYSDLFTDQELQDLAMQMTNSYVENMKNAAAK